jgi:beta-carotene hydroxylase
MAVPRLADIAPDILDNIRPLMLVLIGRPLVGLAVFVLAAMQGWWLVAVPASFLVYGSCLTATHHLIHGSLGLSPRMRHLWLGLLGCVVAESGHALQVTHGHHHRADLSVPDPETSIEYSSWARLPLDALTFRYRLAFWGLAHARRKRVIRLEMAVHAALHLLSLALLPVSPILWVYLTLMHVSSYVFAVLASKGPQTNYGRPVPSPLIRVHTRVGRVFLFSHDLHLEHHAYPHVPVPRLRRLLDDLEPVFAELDTFDVRLPA